MGCVYLARNRANGKRYVGKTVKTMRKRAIAHASDAKRSTPTPFARALKKYGAEGFEWTVLYENDNNAKLMVVEVQMIAMLQTRSPRGYNLTNGGEGSTGYIHSASTCAAISILKTGKRHLPETRAKMSAAHKGKRFTAEHCKNISLAFKGRSISTAQRAQISAFHKGKKLSVEHKAKISKANKGRKFTNETRTKMSAAKQGHPVSVAQRAQISAFHRGRKQSAETIAKRIATNKRNRALKLGGTF